MLHISTIARSWQATLGSPPIDLTIDEEYCAVASETSIVLDNEGSTGCREIHVKCTNVIVHLNEYDTGSHNLEVCDGDVAADYSLEMQNKSTVPFSSIASGNEGHRDGELIRENESENIKRCTCDAKHGHKLLLNDY
jgi:hypothetical protein